MRARLTVLGLQPAAAATSVGGWPMADSLIISRYLVIGLPPRNENGTVFFAVPESILWRRISLAQSRHHDLCGMVTTIYVVRAHRC